ncbi:hypothetical protein [Rhizorhabdus sp. FW153]|uniref:hypothetical protein n=1 Tax=Rhizorhabdus sp. FW153 TaxID=3400216 RepID=UPI003CE69B6E
MASRADAARAMSAERWFFGGTAIAMAASIVIGFLPSYYLRGVIDPGHPIPSLTPLVHLHGLIFTAWMLLYVTQVLLVSADRRDLHRRLGMATVGLLPAMIAIALVSALYQVGRASGPPIVSPLSWLAIPLISVPVFAGLIGAGLARRWDSASHKRYMFLAMIEMTSPGFGRWPWPAFVPGPVVIFGFSDLFLMALIGWDLKQRGSIHRATLIGGGIMVGSQVARFAVWQTEPWLAFARWAAGLVG